MSLQLISNGIYSVEPKLKCIEEDWFLTLLNTKSKKIYLLLFQRITLFTMTYMLETLKELLG